MMKPASRAGFALAVLFAINTMNFFDRQILGAITEPIRKEWGLSDGAMGALGTAFTLLYAVVGVPLGRLTDKTVRTRILSAGVLVWSILTFTSGLARNFWQLFVMRLGVGVGEATCAPAATSLIGDFFPTSKRAKAVSVFMMGLPVGIALSYAVSGVVAHRWGWRSAFFVAGVPGLICTVAALFIHEPKRGASEAHAIGGLRREGHQSRLVQWVLYIFVGGIAVLLGYELLAQFVSRTWAGIAASIMAILYVWKTQSILNWLRPYVLVLSIPTMWWLIASGALQNFNMYAIGSFLSPFLMRFHGVDIQEAGQISMVANGLSGIPGLIIGGIAGDAIMRRRIDGRLLVGALSIFASVPLVYFALGRSRGDITGFMILMSLGIGVMYAYYSTVYSTLQDIIEPASRGTAMALYFFAMYVLGASLGPLGTGLASDYFTQQAAVAEGVTEFTREALEPFRATGLRSAMYVIPVLGALLTLVLFAGSRTVKKDMDNLHDWMRDATEKPAVATASVDTRK